ncbi:MAG: HAD-IA family hydrolase [Planctomycetota bacterium]
MPPLAPPLPASTAPLAAPLPAGLRAVVFDVVHTLVEPWPSVAVAYHEAGARHGVELDPAVIQPRFRAAWRRQEELDAAQTPAFATSRAREADRWRQIVAEVFADTDATDRIFADLWAHFGRPDAWRPLPAGRDLVLAARGAGLPVVLASNFDERLLGLAAVVEPLTLADHVFASSELGWRKPAAEFFRAIERRLDLKPEQLLLVGDDPELDVAAARRAGWHARPVG